MVDRGGAKCGRVSLTRSETSPSGSLHISNRRGEATSMSRCAIDAPTLLHLIAGHITVSQHYQLVAATLIRSQALPLLLTAVRSGELDEDVAVHYQERMTELKMRLLGDRVSRRTEWRIAREQNWDSTYDAEFLAWRNSRPTRSYRWTRE